MISVAPRWIVRAAAAAWLAGAGPAFAQDSGSGLDLLSGDTLTVTADFRLAAANGERSWTDGGFGKTRFGDETRATLAEGAIAWQPKLSFSLGATVVGLVQDKGGKLEAGLSEAYLHWKPLNGGAVRFGARAGLMWPPVSLEHDGAEWAVTDAITPSAINSWIGEEVKVVGAEGSVSATLGGHKLNATAALFDVDDTAGALVALRGWALHDVKGLAGRKMPLPPLGEGLEYLQPRYSHSLKEMDGGLFKRPGGYAKLSWQGPWPVRVELFHYDNNGNPEAVNAYLEWGWRTRFDHVGLVAEPRGGLRLVAQALSGRTRMGFLEGGRRWVDTRFRSAFASASQQVGKGSLMVRVEGFETRNRGAFVTAEDNERGWAATAAGKRTLGEHATVLIELLHVSSRREARERVGIEARQVQTVVQAALRLRW